MCLLGRDGVLGEEVPEHGDELCAVQHGADAEVPAARGGALVGEDVRARDVADVDVGGDGVGDGPLGAHDVAQDVVGADVERLLQHWPQGYARHHHCQLQPPGRRHLRRRDLRHHLGAAVQVLHGNTFGGESGRRDGDDANRKELQATAADRVGFAYV